MSIYRPQELRYAKLDSVKEERALMNNYYNDIIRQHGYDVTYYRRDTDYMSNSTEEAIYGYKSDPKFSKKTGIRAFVEFNDYNFILNGEGFVPSDKVILYFGINEFAVSFVDDIGCFKNYPISATSGYTLRKNNQITMPFYSDVMSGNLVLDVPDNEVVENAEPIIKNASIPCYSVAYNPFIYRSFSTDYRDGYYSANIYVDYDSSSGSRVKYSVHGDILYSNFFENEKVVSEIHPNAGDIIEIDYKTEDGVKEQYEITEVISRKPTNADGLSPFVGKYVYKCAAVRRISSHESLEPEEASKKSRDNIMDYSQNRSDVIDSNNFDWSSPSASIDSDVYGGYSKADTFKKKKQRSPYSKPVDEIFDYDLYEDGWDDGKYTDDNYLIICEFSDKTQLLTNGWNIYWGSKTWRVKVTNIDEPTAIIGKPKNMMYLRVLNGQLVFTTSNLETTVTLTEFSNVLKDGFDYIDGFTYKDVGYRNRDGYYIFKNNRVAINSFGEKKLCAFASSETEDDGKTAKPTILYDRS